MSYKQAAYGGRGARIKYLGTHSFATPATTDQTLSGGEDLVEGEVVLDVWFEAVTAYSGGTTPTLGLETTNSTALTAAVSPETAANLTNKSALLPVPTLMAAADAGTAKLAVGGTVAGGQSKVYALVIDNPAA